MKSVLIISLFLILTQVHCNNFYSLFAFDLQNQSIYDCFQQAGNSKIVIWVFDINNNFLSQTTIKNVVNAKNAGLSVEAFLMPCRNRTAEMEIQILNNAFPYKVFDRYWIYLPDSTTACGWNNYPAASNCQFLQELIIKFQNSFNTPVSMVANRQAWFEIFKDY